MYISIYENAVIILYLKIKKEKFKEHILSRNYAVFNSQTTINNMG